MVWKKDEVIVFEKEERCRGDCPRCWRLSPDTGTVRGEMIQASFNSTAQMGNHSMTSSHFGGTNQGEVELTWRGCKVMSLCMLKRASSAEVFRDITAIRRQEVERDKRFGGGMRWESNEDEGEDIIFPERGWFITSPLPFLFLFYSFTSLQLDNDVFISHLHRYFQHKRVRDTPQGQMAGITLHTNEKEGNFLTKVTLITSVV